MIVVRSLALSVVFLTWSLPAAQDLIRQAQVVLKDQGYYKGPINGKDGPRLREAVRDYQTKHHILANGRLGGETYDSLGIKRDQPAKQMDAAGSTIKSSYADGGRDIGQGGKDLGANIKSAQITDGARDFGVGVGQGTKKIGVGSGKAVVHAAKGVFDAFTPHEKK